MEASSKAHFTVSVGGIDIFNSSAVDWLSSVEFADTIDLRDTSRIMFHIPEYIPTELAKICTAYNEIVAFDFFDDRGALVRSASHYVRDVSWRRDRKGARSFTIHGYDLLEKLELPRTTQRAHDRVFISKNPADIVAIVARDWDMTPKVSKAGVELAHVKEFRTKEGRPENDWDLLHNLARHYGFIVRADCDKYGKNQTLVFTPRAEYEKKLVSLDAEEDLLEISLSMGMRAAFEKLQLENYDPTSDSITIETVDPRSVDPNQKVAQGRIEISDREGNKMNAETVMAQTGIGNKRSNLKAMAAGLVSDRMDDFATGTIELLFHPGAYGGGKVRVSNAGWPFDNPKASYTIRSVIHKFDHRGYRSHIEFNSSAVTTIDPS